MFLNYLDRFLVHIVLLFYRFHCVLDLTLNTVLAHSQRCHHRFQQSERHPGYRPWILSRA